MSTDVQVESLLKATFSQGELIRAIGTVQNFISGRSTLPALSYVLLEVAEEAKLTATDLRVGIECRFAVEASERGKACLPAQKFFEVIKELPEGTVELELGENYSCRIRGGKSRFNLLGMAPEEFPEVPQLEDGKEIRIEQNHLKELVSRTAFAVSKEEARFALSGLYFDIQPKELKIVGTDGRRLAYGETSQFEGEVESVGLIVPEKTAREVARLLEGSESVLIRYNENLVAFAFGNVYVVSRLVEGTFPNYDVVIPKSLEKKLVLKSSEFTNLTRRAAIVTSLRNNLVKFTLETGQLKVECETSEIGNMDDSMEVDYSGEVVEIGFNPDYVLDVLKAIDCEEVEWSLKGSTDPAIFRPISLKKESPLSFLYVIMPIRLR